MSQLIHATKTHPCKICNNSGGWCYEVSESLCVCKRSDIAPPGWIITSRQDAEGHSYFAVKTGKKHGSEDTDWEAKKAEREANEKEALALDLKTRLGIITRDSLIRSLSQELGLSNHHRQILIDRGMSETEIDRSLFFSIEQWQQINNNYPLNLPGVYLSKLGDRQLAGTGIAIVTKDELDRASGWQVMTIPRDPEKKYIWARGEKSSHLPVGKGELPIQVTSQYHSVAFGCEGTFKPVLAAIKHQKYFIGASSGNFSNSTTQVTAALTGRRLILLAIDGGDILNPHRMKHWQRQAEFFESIAVRTQFMWWGQIEKGNNDVDEIPTTTLENATLLSIKELSRISQHYQRKVRSWGFPK
jgi:hypothetical protein